MADRKPQETPGIPDILSIDSIGGITPVAPIAPIAPPATAVPATGSAKGKVTGIEVAAYWIDKYSACGGERIEYGQRVAAGFASVMSSLGHRVAFTRASDQASPKQWNAWGDKSEFGIDTVEFVFLATHGATYGKERPNDWLYFWLGTFDRDGCYIWTVEAQPVQDKRTLRWRWEPKNIASPKVFMRLGEGRLRWLVLDTCSSLQVGVENLRPARGYRTAADSLEEKYLLRSSNPFLTWSRCCDGVNTIFGFTGLSSDYSGTSLRGASFGRRAGRGEPMGDAWIDEAYAWLVDDAPVAFACGTSEDDAVKRVNGETLKSPARSLRHPQIGGYAWIWRI
jgi:hypothetical protein